MGDSKAFVSGLEQEIDLALAQLGETEALTFETKGSLAVPALLAVALRNEMDAVMVAGAWLGRVGAHPGAQMLRLALARQAGDEARHHFLIVQRLAELDAPAAEGSDAPPAPGPLTAWLLTLEDPVEQMAAGPFAREALAVVKNRQFINLCRSRGDMHTAALYERHIQPDEQHHHTLGVRYLQRYCIDDASQARAAAAARRTLSLADEMAHMARGKGAVAAPGC